MKFINGIVLQQQRKNLRFGIQYLPHEIIIPTYELYEWCDKNFGYATYSNFTHIQHWQFVVGTKFNYWFFKTKADALLFKLTCLKNQGMK